MITILSNHKNFYVCFVCACVMSSMFWLWSTEVFIKQFYIINYCVRVYWCVQINDLFDVLLHPSVTELAQARAHNVLHFLVYLFCECCGDITCVLWWTCPPCIGVSLILVKCTNMTASFTETVPTTCVQLWLWHTASHFRKVHGMCMCWLHHHSDHQK